MIEQAHNGAHNSSGPDLRRHQTVRQVQEFCQSLKSSACPRVPRVITLEKISANEKQKDQIVYEGNSTPLNCRLSHICFVLVTLSWTVTFFLLEWED